MMFKKIYLYQLTTCPSGTGLGIRLDGHMSRVEDGSKYGCLIYDRPICESDVKTFALVPITKAKALVGRHIEIPCGLIVNTYHIDHVSEDGTIYYHVNDEDPLRASFDDLMTLIKNDLNVYKRLHLMHTMLTIHCATLPRDAIKITDEIKIDDDSTLYLYEIHNRGRIHKSAGLYCAPLDSYMTLSMPHHNRPESASDDLASWDWDTIF